MGNSGLQYEPKLGRLSGMLRGPNGETRPADVVGCAVAVAKIATGEVDETLVKKSGRVRSGHAGAKARAESLTQEERSAIAQKAAAVRWSSGRS